MHQRRTLTLKAVVFDFDGTLALLNVDFKAMRLDILGLAASYGISDDGLEGLFVLEMIAEIRRRIGRRAPGREGDFAGRALQLVTDRELAGAERSALFPGVREMLAELRRRGVKRGILTRNCLEAVTAVFPDIGRYSEAVVTRSDAERVKPHPDHIRTVLGILDEDPSKSAMVGDHPMDIRVGKAVGALSVGVLTGYSAASDLLEAGADLILERAAEITSHIE
ncbi:MAG TPA: HAD family hydrolase [Syntrophales bacterium]|nr:HAD family hydrolase [Syntrophales bacterium]